MNWIKIINSRLLSSCFYINLSNIRKYLIIKLILTIINYKKGLNGTNTNILIYIIKHYKIKQIFFICFLSSCL